MVVIHLVLGEGSSEDGERLWLVEASDEIARKVVRRAERRVQVRWWRNGHPRHIADRRLGREGDHCMSLVVEAASACPAGHLRVLSRGQHRSPRAAVLGEALQDDGAGRHVDAQREGLSGEHCAEEALAEAGLHRLAEGRDEPGVMGGEARLEAFEPLVVAERVELIVVELGDVVLSDRPDTDPLGAADQPKAVAQQLANGVVARSPREDEHDRRQQVVALKQGDELRASRADEGWRRARRAATAP